MRHLQTAGLAAAVALALGAVAHAATTGGTVFLSQRGNFTMTSPRIPGPANAAATTTTNNTTTTNTTQTPQNTTTVDQRAEANRQAVSSTFASGSQSSLGPVAGTATVATGPFGAGTTSGTGVTGTATGTTTTTGTPTTGVTTGGGVAAFGNVGTSVGVPIFANPADLTTGLAPVSVAANTTPTFTNADILAGASIAQNGIAVTESQFNAANVDRAIAQVSRDRKRIGRNGQLLYSIAPRTNVDRTAQMPDDPLPPALTGSNSTLTR